MILKVQKINPEAILPEFVHDGDAGMDLFSVEEIVLNPGENVGVPTGIKIEIPDGYAGFVWDKSGLALNRQIKTMAGVVDSNYRGELKVVLYNLGKSPYKVEKGSKVAQLVISKVERPELKEGEVDADSERGERGFTSGK